LVIHFTCLRPQLDHAGYVPKSPAVHGIHPGQACSVSVLEIRSQQITHKSESQDGCESPSSGTLVPAQLGPAGGGDLAAMLADR
jgi:hypothetical protein